MIDGIQKAMLVQAVIQQIKSDVAGGDESAINELLGFLNEDVMIGFIDEGLVDAIFPAESG